MASQAQDRVSVQVRRDLYERARRYLELQGTFSSVDELVEFLLEEFLRDQPQEAMTKEEEEAVRDRLRRLGYL